MVQRIGDETGESGRIKNQLGDGCKQYTERSSKQIEKAVLRFHYCCRARSAKLRNLVFAMLSSSRIVVIILLKSSSCYGWAPFSSLLRCTHTKWWSVNISCGLKTIRLTSGSSGSNWNHILEGILFHDTSKQLKICITLGPMLTVILLYLHPLRTTTISCRFRIAVAF